MKRATQEEVLEWADRLVSRLERWHAEGDRGPLARVRRGLSEATRHEAWPVIGRLFGELGVGHPVFETVAGCFAVYPSENGLAIGNFGETMRDVMGNKMREEKEPHTRFRRLLACDSQDEICHHVRHAVRLAKSKDAAINYRQLFVDMWWWNDRPNPKVEWAKDYWHVPVEPPERGIAGVGTPVEEESAPMPE
jgi:CRISPR-associated protein Cse2 family